MEFDNIRFMSYIRLMKNEDSIEILHPDYIILDEFHRCGAAEWGKSVRKLLNACPNAKRLGLSATNIRYLDNQRNMAEEIFDGKIASEMTLGEAIVRGILPEPKYVIAMYSYKKELDQLKKRIRASSQRTRNCLSSCAVHWNRQKGWTLCLRSTWKRKMENISSFVPVKNIWTK